MCTTFAVNLNDNWYLGKTRDPVRWMRYEDEIKLFHTPADKCAKWLIQNPEPHEDGYYGGLNEHGVAFVSTYVHIAENQISYIRRPYVRLILNALTAKEATEIIQSFNPRIGGNMFVADSSECYGIEGVPDEYFIEPITQPSVKTNHYLHLHHRNLGFDTEPGFEAWSHTHQQRAEELLEKSNNLDDLINILKDRENSDKKQAICTTEAEDPCYTYSAFVFDINNKTAHYTQGNPLTTSFKPYTF